MVGGIRKARLVCAVALAGCIGAAGLIGPGPAAAEVKPWPGKGPIFLRDHYEVKNLPADELLTYLFDRGSSVYSAYLTFEWESEEIFYADDAAMMLSTSNVLGPNGILDPTSVILVSPCDLDPDHDGATWKYRCRLSFGFDQGLARNPKIPKKSQRYPGRPYYLQLCRPASSLQSLERCGAAENATAVFTLREGRLELPVTARKAKVAASNWASGQKIKNAKITCAATEEGDMFCRVIGTRRGKPVDVKLGVYRNSNLAVRATPI